MELVFNRDGRSLTTSRLIAEKFFKVHKNVIRDIKNLKCSTKFNRLNFEPIDYTDKRNRTQQEYLITRNGFTMLVMGFTGAAAMQFKEEYIAKFDEMEAKLKALEIQQNKPVAPTSAFEALELMFSALKENRQGIQDNKDEIHLLKQEVLEVSAKVTNIDDEYFTIAGFGKTRGMSIPINTARKLGKQATKLSQERGILIGFVKDARFGRVNTYHTYILNIIFTNFKNQ